MRHYVLEWVPLFYKLLPNLSQELLWMVNTFAARNVLQSDSYTYYDKVPLFEYFIGWATLFSTEMRISC